MIKEHIAFTLRPPEDGPFLPEILDLINRAGLDFETFLNQATLKRFDDLSAQIARDPLPSGPLPEGPATTGYAVIDRIIETAQEDLDRLDDEEIHLMFDHESHLICPTHDEPIAFDYQPPKAGPYLIQLHHLIKRTGIGFEKFMNQAVFNLFDDLEVQQTQRSSRPTFAPANDNAPQDKAANSSNDDMLGDRSPSHV